MLGQSKKNFFIIASSLAFIPFVFQNCGKMEVRSFFSSSMEHEKASEIPDHYEKVELQSTKSFVPVGNRKYVASVLKDVFAHPQFEMKSEMNTTDQNSYQHLHNIINGYIERRADVFRGVCAEMNHRGDCSSAKLNEFVADHANSEVKRNSLVIYTCDRILTSDKYVRWFIDKITPENESSYDRDGTLFPSRSHVKQALEMFYLGHDFPEETLDRLMDLGSEVQSGEQNFIDAWRMIISGICHSPGWQLY